MVLRGRDMQNSAENVHKKPCELEKVVFPA